MRIFIILCLISCLLGTTSYAQSKSLGQRIDEAEFTIYQTHAKVDVLYAMTKKLFIEKYGREEYEKTVFEAGESIPKEIQ